MTIFKRLLY